jgi:hypothetical protein
MKVHYIFPILHLWKIRLREVQQYVQTHTAGKRQNWDLSSEMFGSKAGAPSRTSLGTSTSSSTHRGMWPATGDWGTILRMKVRNSGRLGLVF